MMRRLLSVQRAVFATAISLTIGIASAQAGIIQQWTFDTNLAEANGGAVGTVINDAAVQVGAGISGGALYFDGGDDAVSIAGSVVPNSSVSFSFWSKSDGDTVGYMICDSANVVNFFLRHGTSTEYNAHVAGQNSYYRNFGPYATNAWHHHVLISNQETGEVFWYVDNEIGRTGGPEVLAGFSSDLYLGNRADLARDYKGWIDDLQIYDYALTLEDVTYLNANPGETLAVPEPSIIMLLLTALAGLLIVRRR